MSGAIEALSGEWRDALGGCISSDSLATLRQAPEEDEQVIRTDGQLPLWRSIQDAPSCGHHRCPSLSDCAQARSSCCRLHVDQMQRMGEDGGRHGPKRHGSTCALGNGHPGGKPPMHWALCDEARRPTRARDNARTTRICTVQPGRAFKYQYSISHLRSWSCGYMPQAKYIIS